MPSVLEQLGFGESEEEKNPSSVLDALGFGRREVPTGPQAESPPVEGTLLGKAFRRGAVRPAASFLRAVEAGRGPQDVESISGGGLVARFMRSVGIPAPTAEEEAARAAAIKAHGFDRLDRAIGATEGAIHSLRPSRPLSTFEEIVSGAAEAVPMMGVAAAAYAVGGPLAALGATFTSGFGNAYGDAQQKEDVPEEDKLLGAIAAGIVESVGETLPLGRLARILKGPMQGPKRYLAEAAKKALGQAPIEAGTEYVQEIAQRLSALATYAQDEEWGPEDWRRAAIAAGSGGLLGLVSGGATGAMRTAFGRQNDRAVAAVQDARNTAIQEFPDLPISESNPLQLTDEFSRSIHRKPVASRGEAVTQAIAEDMAGTSRLQGVRGYEPPPPSLTALQPTLLDQQEVGRQIRLNQMAKSGGGLPPTTLKNMKENAKHHAVMARDATFSKFLDPDWRLRAMEQAAARKRGSAKRGEFMVGSPYLAVEELPWFGAVAQGLMLDKKQSVYDPVENAGVSMDEFGEWVALTRIIEGDRQEMENPAGHDRNSATLRRFDIEQQFGPEKTAVVRDAAREYNRIHQERVVRGWMAESRIAEPETQARAEENDHWARFFVQRHINDEKARGGFAPDYLKHQIGTSSEIGNVLLESDLAEAILIRASMVNIAKLASVDFLDNYAPDDIIPYEDGDAIPEGKKVLHYWLDGEPMQALVPDFIVEGVESDFDPARGVIMKILNSSLKNPMREILTERSIPFAMFNIVRDPSKGYFAMRGGAVKDAVELTRLMMRAFPVAFQSTWPQYFGGKEPALVLDMLSKGQIPPIRSGVYHSAEMHPMDLLREHFMDAGHELPHRLDVVKDGEKLENAFTRAIERAAEVPIRDLQKKVGKGLDLTFFFSRKIPEFSERWSKITARMYVDDHPELFPTRQHGSHEIRSNFGTPNIYRKTPEMALLDNVSLFGSIALRGHDSNVEIFQRDPENYIKKTVISTAIPIATMAAAAAGLMGKEFEEFFRLVPSHDKRNYTIIPIGFMGEGDSQKAVYIRIPRDHGMQLIGNALWSSFEAARKGDPESLLKNLGRLVRETLPWADPNPILENSTAAWKIFVEGENHTDSFRGVPVVDPHAMAAGEDVAEQYGRWAWNNAGLSILFNFQDQKSVTTHIEELQRLPGVGKILQRMVKVSNGGKWEESWEKFRGPIREEESRKTYLRRKSMTRFLEQNGPHLRTVPSSEFRNLWRSHVDDGIQYSNPRALILGLQEMVAGEHDFGVSRDRLTPDQRREFDEFRRSIGEDESALPVFRGR